MGVDTAKTAFCKARKTLANVWRH